MIYVTPAQLIEAQAKLPTPAAWPRIFIDIPVCHCCVGARSVRFMARRAGKLGWVWVLDEGYGVMVQI